MRVQDPQPGNVIVLVHRVSKLPHAVFTSAAGMRAWLRERGALAGHVYTYSEVPMIMGREATGTRTDY